ncbi:MAG: asparagine synthase (glutamine-hydrolyzing) [Desulfovibrionaceae bacterium]|nr:asparagine synthase (glutamine-hydrolyzing) [Desulfovibrionaceae bacterium]
MSGIFGWLVPPRHARHDMRRVASSLFDALKERGPDDQGYVVFDRSGELIATEKEPAGGDERPAGLLLGHARLAVMHAAEAGRRPVRSKDGRYTLVLNGEIFNSHELKLELAGLGVHFRGAADAEALLYALAHWGTACLTRLVGAFAFALHDARENTLLCARDFFGIKPLYWTQPEDGAFAFASELPALLRIPGVRRRLDWVQAYNFLAGSRIDVGGECLLQGIFQLKPAHCLLISAETGRIIREERYWQVPLPQAASISFEEAAEEARRLFLESVRLHLRSDVPLGFALSGGIDSSSVLCAARRLEPDMPLHTFTYVAADSADISEERWADQAIKHTGAIAHKVVVSQDELQRDLDRLIMRQGEPFNSTSIYAQYRVFQLVRENGVIVTLDGQGADEMLAGYFGYPHYRLQTLLGKGQLWQALRFIHTCGKWPGRDHRNLFKRYIAPYVPRLLKFLAHRLVKKPLDPAWLNLEALRDREALRFLSWDPGIYSSPDKVREILAQQLTWAGLPNLLRHGDRNAMSFSVESRVPFCTKGLAEFFLSLPEEHLISDEGWTKAVFRRAMRGIVPDALLDRRDKIGFATPEKLWFFSMRDWVRENLDEARSSLLFNYQGLLAEWEAILEGRQPFDWRVWRWINYLRWKRLFAVEE